MAGIIPKFHHVHPKDYSFKPYDPLYDEYSGHFVHYDKFGRRVKSRSASNASKEEIWFLGDSFTEGIQVPYDSSFVGIVQRHLGDSINCVNYANASYSPLLHTIILNDALKANTPKEVYIQVYSNDISDDNKYSKTTTYSNGLPVKCYGGNPDFIVSKLRKSYLARNLRRIYWTFKYINFERGEELTFRHHVEHSPELDSDGHFVKNILAIDSILNEKSIPHYFFAIPSKYTCFTGDWESKSFDKTFNNFTSENDLPFVDVRSYFRKTRHPSKVFFYRDIHLSAYGNRVLAQSLIDHHLQN